MPKTRVPLIIPRAEHCISRDNISSSALKVLYRLKDAGFAAYLVGGGVRDLLLNIAPKDFDIATNALPEEIKNLFRNCILIGRRFRLAHIRFGHEIIEVATFRADHSKATGEEARSLDGLILRDNVYGTIEEDAIRRDFTINALYYNIADFSVVDYCGGLNDLKKKQLKMIGDPLQRYQEDPVRLLRAIRFAAKLDFKIEKKTAAAIQEIAYLLHQTAPPRLFEEMIKLFLKGHAEKTYDLLKEYDIFKEIFPVSAYVLTHPDQYPVEKLFHTAMKNSDARIAEYKSLNPAFILAVFLWYPFLIERERAKQHGLSDIIATQEGIYRTLKEQQHIVQITKRFASIIEEIWRFQFRLERRYWRAILKLLSHPRFRAAYDFLLLRAEAGEFVGDIAEWWTQIYHADDDTRTEMIQKIKTHTPLATRKKK